jgi:hypothetical protein
MDFLFLYMETTNKTSNRKTKKVQVHFKKNPSECQILHVSNFWFSRNFNKRKPITFKLKSFQEKTTETTFRKSIPNYLLSDLRFPLISLKYGFLSHKRILSFFWSTVALHLKRKIKNSSAKFFVKLPFLLVLVFLVRYLLIIDDFERILLQFIVIT